MKYITSLKTTIALVLTLTFAVTTQAQNYYDAIGSLASPTSDIKCTGTTQNPYDIGDTVKSFSLKNIDGKMVSLNDFADKKGVILVFTCNTCPYAQKYEQRIIGLDTSFRSKGYPVVAINPNDAKRKPGDSYAEMQKLAKDKNYPFDYLIDETQSVAKAFGATKTPHTYLLKKEGTQFKIVYIGAIDDNPQSTKDVKHKYIEKAIEELEAGKKVSKTKTRAIGCTIKWKQA